MTGFGSATGAVGGREFEVEVRSVNHRHLMVKMRLLTDDASVDAEVEALVKKQITRGSVSISMRVQPSAETNSASIDAEVARRYRDRLQGLAADLGVSSEVTLGTLLALPGVVQPARDQEADSALMRRAILTASGKALTRLVEMRTVEGGALSADLTQHAKRIRVTLGKIGRRMPEAVRGNQRQLHRRVGELMGGSSTLSPSDLAREIAVIADRMDVSEEMSRLGSHLDQLETMLAKGGCVGRKLDFLVQEFFREVNTIGSKCNDAKVSHWVVDLKTHVERLREQVQNVE